MNSKKHHYLNGCFVLIYDMTNAFNVQPGIMGASSMAEQRIGRKNIAGNGSVNSGETDWQNASDLGLRVQITRPKNNSNSP